MRRSLLLFILLTGPVLARVEDNSFLLEEAYNQNPGEIQLIQRYQTFQHERPEYGVEIEAPITDNTHQFSLAIGRQENLSDLEVGYRFQAINVEGKMLTEGLRIILPTGSLRNESDHGVVGYEWLQSATVVFNEKISNHWNLGVRVYPNAESPSTSDDRTLTNFIGGTSLVYYYQEDLNFLLEGLFESEEMIDDRGEIESEVRFNLNPGVRFAWNIDWQKSQIVPGIAFPVVFNDEKTNPGVFFYFSWESTLF